METPDLNSERLETLKKLYPDLFTVEGKLNTHELEKLVDPAAVHETERYEFKWFGKSEAKRRAFTPSRATLRYDVDRSVNPDKADGNMIIEGENLETLKCLLAAYREKIKCIYIDPPYNTGKDFVYSDKWDESKESYWEHIGVTKDGVRLDTNTDSSGRYHSNWLNMMYSRLLIARQLLREDGVIFISIDDTEVHHLRKLCDEIFGEDNLVGEITWLKRAGRSNDAKLMNNVAEYIAVYRKSDKLSQMREPRPEESNKGYSNPDNDPRGDWTSISYVSQRPKSERPNLCYSIINPYTNNEIYHPTHSWKYSKEQTDLHIKENRLYWGEAGNHTYPRLKVFMSELKEGLVPINFWNYKNSGSIDEGTKEVDQLLGINVFDYPKPVRLLKKIIETAASENEIVLDFFAGSGTTAQAVMELNKEDGGNRKFVLIQIPELTDEKSEAHKAGYKKISDITIERNKRVTARIENEMADKPDLFKDKDLSLGFKVYRLAKSNFPRVDFRPDPDKSEEENAAALEKYILEKEASFISLTNAADVMDEVLLKNGFKLNYSKEKIKSFKKNDLYKVSDGERSALICLDMKIEPDTFTELQSYKDTKFICLEQSLDTKMKWNLKQLLGDYLVAF